MRVTTLFFVAGFALLIGGCGGGGTNVTPPVVNGEIAITAAVGAAGLPYHYQIPWPDMPTGVTYKATDLPAWASVDSNGAIVGTPAEDSVAAWLPITVTATSIDKIITATGHMVVEHGAATLAYTDDYKNILDYYATTWNGKKRQLRNDLTGDLEGEIQFIQSHTAAPNNNWQENKQDQTQSIYRPNLVSWRDVLVVLIPTQKSPPITIDLRVSSPGKADLTVSMAPPEAIPAPDKQPGHSVTYSKRAWSAVIPWDYVKTGMALHFISDAGAPSAVQGSLSADNIDYGKASYMVYSSIKLGMLTAPTTAFKYTVDAPIKAANEYFSTIPVSKLVMSVYAPMELPRVIVSDRSTEEPTIYAEPEHSATTGSVYSGDMRGDVAKSTVGMGIDTANFGISSNTINQSYDHVFKIDQVHFSQGAYTNGVVTHGLSGGNGVATLISGRGNEASHEWGHNYGMGHYPGRGLTQDGRWAFHNPSEGWEYLPFYHRLRVNLGKYIGNNFPVECQWGNPDYPSQAAETPARICQNGWIFQNDPMSGGNYGASPLSDFTNYTARTAGFIQRDVGSYPVPDASYPSGYKMWNTQLGEYQEWDENKPVPVAVGVPVATILGGYDPDYPSDYQYQGTAQDQAVIYPTFHGNYGNVFDLPAPDLSDGQDHCWVDVSNAAGTPKLVEIAHQRLNAGVINRLSFNLHASFKPTLAELYCRISGKTTRLTKTVLDGKNLTTQLPPPAIVGQENGFKQLKANALKAIEKGVMALDANALYSYSLNLAVKISAYSQKGLKSGLPITAAKRAIKIKQAMQANQHLNRVVGYANQLDMNAQQKQQLVTQFLKGKGFIDAGITGNPVQSLTGSALLDHYDEAYLMTTTNKKGQLDIQQNLNGKESHQWVMDVQNKLHPVNQPYLCLTASGGSRGTVTLQSCSTSAAGQRWQYRTDTKQLVSAANSDACLDDHSTQHYAETWNCHATGGANQGWTGLVRNDALWLGLLNGNSIKQVKALLSP